jgi:hypothetical protein
MASKTKSEESNSRLDVVFDGTWVLAPRVDDAGKIEGVDVYSPACGHPHGICFVNDINPKRWPVSRAFYQLQDHGHRVSIQRARGAKARMPVSGIDRTANHCLDGRRPMASNWDVMISIDAGPDDWISSDTMLPETTDSSGKTVSCFSGKDAPAGKVSSLQTLRFNGVKGVFLGGAPAAAHAMLPEPWSGSGTLIFAGEIPYIANLHHQRAAYSAMATLAGLDLALNFPLPAPAGRAPAPGRLGIHTVENCSHSLIVLS